MEETLCRVIKEKKDGVVHGSLTKGIRGERGEEEIDGTMAGNASDSLRAILTFVRSSYLCP